MRIGKLKSLAMAFGLFAPLVLLTGCGPAKGSLSGKVTLDGIPLKGGRIDFANKSGGQSATIEIGEDGGYSLPVMFAAEYDVTVTTEYLKGPTGSRPGGGRPPGAPGAPPAGAMKGIPKDNKDVQKHEPPEGYVASMPGDSAKKYVKIPGKYGEVGELTYTFPGGNKEYNIQLSAK